MSNHPPDPHADPSVTWCNHPAGTSKLWLFAKVMAAIAGNRPSVVYWPRWAKPFELPDPTKFRDLRHLAEAVARMVEDAEFFGRNQRDALHEHQRWRDDPAGQMAKITSDLRYRVMSRHPDTGKAKAIAETVLAMDWLASLENICQGCGSTPEQRDNTPLLVCLHCSATKCSKCDAGDYDPCPSCKGDGQ